MRSFTSYFRFLFLYCHTRNINIIKTKVRPRARGSARTRENFIIDTRARLITSQIISMSRGTYTYMENHARVCPSQTQDRAQIFAIENGKSVACIWFAVRKRVFEFALAREQTREKVSFAAVHTQTHDIHMRTHVREQKKKNTLIG